MPQRHQLLLWRIETCNDAKTLVGTILSYNIVPTSVLASLQT